MTKQLFELNELQIVDLGDVVPVYDSSEPGIVKTKKATAFELMMFKNSAGKGFNFTVRNGLSLNLIHNGNTRISVLDFLVFIDYTDLSGITFGIKNTFGGTWVDNTDPRLAYLSVSCIELGTNMIDIRLNNGVDTLTIAQTYFILQDNLGLCT
jgi:hypothetical protein